MSLKRCFRCLDFGHITAKSTGNRDRSKGCRKLTGECHIFREWKADTERMLCKGKKWLIVSI